jgi:hypothetical protein
MSRQWIGVDFDRTLAYFDEWRGASHAGQPIPLMVRRVKDWLASRQLVKIFTARADETQEDYAENIKTIQEWCFHVFGEILEITNKKDKFMIQLWDDKAIQIIENTGYRIDGGV